MNSFIVARIITFIIGVLVLAAGTKLILSEVLLWGVVLLIFGILCLVGAFVPVKTISEGVAEETIGKVFVELPLRGIIKVIEHIF